MRVVWFGLVVALAGCTGPGTGTGGDAGGEGEGEPAGGDCGDDDPLTNSGWVGFCEDRVDDNCTQDVDEDCPEITSNTIAGVHHFGCTDDEKCPQSAPGAAAPDWDCTGAAPDAVIAYATYADAANEQVQSFCAYVYESAAVAGEFFATVVYENGTEPNGPSDPSIGVGGLCSADFSARRYLFFSDLDAACDPVRFIHAYSNESPTGVEYPVDDQKLSNRCRKAIRNITRSDPTFSPPIQFFAASEDEARAKLDVLETAEIACVGIDAIDGDPYRTTEVFVVQADAPLTLVPR